MLKIMELPCGPALFMFLTADGWGFGEGSLRIWIRKTVLEFPSMTRISVSSHMLYL